MPFARFLYNKFHEKTLGMKSSEYWSWETLTDKEKAPWEEYAKVVSAYLVP